MSFYLQGFRYLGYLLKERIRNGPLILVQGIGLAIVFEANRLIGMFFPALLLGLVMQPSGRINALTVVIILSFILSALDFAGVFQRRTYSNHSVRAMQYKFLSLNKKAMSADLLAAESYEGQERLGKAGNGIFISENADYYLLTIILGSTIALVVTFGVFADIHWGVVLFIAGGGVIDFVFKTRRSKIMIELDREMAATQHRLQYMNRTMFDLDNVRDIQLFNKKAFLSFHLGKIKSELRQMHMMKETTSIKYEVALSIIPLFRTIVIYAFAIWQFYIGQLELPHFLLFASAIAIASVALHQILDNIVNILEMSTHYEATLDYMNRASTTEQGQLPMPKTLEELRFENVSFRYPNTESDALSQVTFSLCSNDVVALVGENGAGKSTIIKLILRLYPTTSGRILLNGQNINDYNYTDYVHFFASVFQDFNIFALTIEENIKFDNECADIPQVLERIKLIDKINSLPRGLGTPYTQELDDDGVLFSGGEAQKLAIARAICKNAASILTMDEPASALDPIAEYELNSLTRQSSCDNVLTIFVTHRLSTTRFCNKILVLDNGRLVENGSHSDLLQQSGLYANMYNMQIEFFKDGDRGGKNLYE